MHCERSRSDSGGGPPSSMCGQAAPLSKPRQAVVPSIFAPWAFGFCPFAFRIVHYVLPHVPCDTSATPLSKQHPALVPSISGDFVLLGRGGGLARPRWAVCATGAGAHQDRPAVRGKRTYGGRPGHQALVPSISGHFPLLGHGMRMGVTPQNRPSVPTERRVSCGGATTHVVQIVQQGAIRRHHKPVMKCLWATSGVLLIALLPFRCRLSLTGPAQ